MFVVKIVLKKGKHGGILNFCVLLLLLIFALNTINQRRILGNIGQLVGRLDVSRAAKSTRRKVLSLGLRLRLVTINCRCISEDNNEVENY